eukprot:jgi/Mesen1/6459/ME000033S05752
MEGSGTQDEIDFEFLGNQKNAVQTNYYVNGSCEARHVFHRDQALRGSRSSDQHASPYARGAPGGVPRAVLSSQQSGGGGDSSGVPSRPPAADAPGTLSPSPPHAAPTLSATADADPPAPGSPAAASNSTPAVAPAPSASPAPTPVLAGNYYGLPTIVFDAGNASHFNVNQAAQEVIIYLDSGGLTARARSLYNYPIGTSFSALVWTPDQNPNGTVTAFYVSSLEVGLGEGLQDQIDFEFLGNQPYAVQTNYFVRGWYVDGALVRQVYCFTVPPYQCPSLPVYSYQSLWDASFVAGGQWAGTINYAFAPFFAYFESIMVWPV